MEEPMKKQDFLRFVEDVLEVDTNSIDDDTLLVDIENWDSLAFVSFIALVDEHLEVTLEPSSLADAISIADLLAPIMDKFKG